MGLFDVKLSYKNQDLMDIFNRVVDPTNQFIDWQSYFLFCYLDDYKDMKTGVDILLHIRNTVNDYKNKRLDNSKNKSNNISNENKNTTYNNDDDIKKVEYKKKDNKNG